CCWKAQAYVCREGITLSEKSLIFLDWTLLLINVSVCFLSVEEVVLLAWVRWQIELFFKLWKSYSHLVISCSVKLDHILCEVYVKLLVVLIQHWLLVVHAWYYPNRSWTKVV